MAHPVIQILNVGDIAELIRADRTDGQLLDLFVQKRDQEAFATLVRRHGGLVLGVCQRVLRNHADADDAFQAAFLVLARKAGTLRTRELLGKWLHGVAFNTARKLRRTNGRRAAREQPLDGLSEPVAGDGIELRGELLAILDEELNKLPERYRVPIVLCDLEGATRKEAARIIGCPEGTVAGRLARARALLAERLASRGIAPSSGILAAILTQRSASAVTPALVAGVMRTIGGAVSSRVACLAEGVVTSMFLNTLKTASIAVLICGLAIAGLASAFRSDATAGTEPAAPPEEKANPKKLDGEAKVLTVIPLKKLDAIDAWTRLTKLSPDTFIFPIANEKTLLVYAGQKETAAIEAALVGFGEESRKSAALFRLKNVKSAEAARVLKEVFGSSSRVTVVPVPNENALIVYATESDIQTIRLLLDKAIDAVAVAQPKPAATPVPEKTFTINFRNVAWKDVIEWYAKKSGFTLIGDRFPTGTVTLQPPKDRKFTIGEITDLLNEALTQQKFIIIRRNNTFILHPADEKVDGSLIPRVEFGDLKNYGRTELVEVEFKLAEKVNGVEFENEVRKYLTTFGEIFVFAKSNRVFIRDSASNISRIYSAATNPKNPEANLIEVIKPPRQPETTPSPVKQSARKAITFDMKEVPWEEVLEWYAKFSGLTPILTTKPTGTFSYIPPDRKKEYTLGEITDILNQSLASQKLQLIRRQVTFIIHPLDKMIEIGGIPRIELTDLPSFGKSELVQVLIPLKELTVEDTAPEVQKLLTPFGSVSKLVKTNTLVILDTAGNIQRIYETIQQVEKSIGNEPLNHICKYKKAQEMAETLKTLLSDNSHVVTVQDSPYDPRQHRIAVDKNGRVKVTIVVDAKNNSLTITAPPEKIGIVERIIEDTDKPRNPGDKPITLPDPVIRKYPVPPGTAEAVAKALQADMPSIRVMALSLSNEVMVYATPEEHLKLSWLKEFGPKAVVKKTELIPILVGDPKEYAAKLQELLPKPVLGPDIRPCFWGLPAIIVTGTAEQIQVARDVLKPLEGINGRK